MAALRPLLLMTRPKSASEAFWDALPAKVRDSVDLLINPLLSIQVTGVLPPLEGAKGLIFTSANALQTYKQLNGAVLKIPVIVVGEGTALAAEAFGFEVDIAGGNAELLVQHIVERGYSGPLVHLRGENAIGEVAQRLTDAGVQTTEAILYDQVLKSLTPETMEALSQDRPIIAPVFSPRTARQLSSESEKLGTMQIAGISQSIADALPEQAAKHTHVAATPNLDGMVRLVTNMIEKVVANE